MMNKTYLKKIVILVLLIFISCNTKVRKGNIETIKVDSKSEKVRIKFEDYFSSKKTIALETNENSLLSRIDRIAFHESKIFILDKKLNSVLVFKDDGSFLYKIKNIGRGPQEYNSLMDFTIDTKNNTIILYTDRPYALFIHKMDGSFIKKIKLNSLYFELASTDGTVLFLNKDIEKEYSLIHYDTESNEEKGFVPINDRDKIYSNVGIGRSSLTIDKNIHLSLPYSDTIYEQDKNGVEAKYYVDFGKQKMPEEKHVKKQDIKELFAFMRGDKYACGICEFRENEDYITFNYNETNLVIYSKKTKKSKIVSIINNDDLIFGSYIAHSGNDNNFVSIIPAHIFKMQMDDHKSNGLWEKLPKSIKQLDASITSNDNPLLLIYTFK